MNPNDTAVNFGGDDLPYRHQPLRIDQFGPTLRQAIMAMEPDFFAWDSERQDRYRRDLPDEAEETFYDKLKTSAALSLGQPPDKIDLDRMRDIDILNVVNEHKLPFFGIGEDSFFLNEPRADWYDMQTVEDLSRSHYKSDPGRPENDLPFMGQFYPVWCRYFYKGRLNYATLNAFHHHVYDVIEEQNRTMIDQLIPHRYVKGKNHGKRTKGGYQWDYKVDANGLEGQLDEVTSRARDKQNALYLQALKDCDARDSGRVYRVRKVDDTDTMTTWVFDGPRAMKRVRLTHFNADLREIRASRRVLAALVEPYAAEAGENLQAEYDDVTRNWNPKLTKLKKKRQVVISDKAADDLMD